MSSSNTKMEELRLSHARGHWFKSSTAHHSRQIPNHSPAVILLACIFEEEKVLLLLR